ncbi:MAG: GntG family PLP-dependent aldolase [Candidatus Nanopelagicaceae bacterium]|nr:GntG family PLP-dependent aldolase [Candidatus Nanopelagicaceae bacterium]
MRVDLRSDTVTVPSQGMREAIAEAPVGDDVYGEDLTVNSLEERVALMFGKEAALFTPTGSLANQLAIRMLVAPGEELLAETFSHIVRAELGAAAVFSGITTRTWQAPRGLLKARDAMEIARPDSGPYQVSTTAIAVENTHNFGGGTIQPLKEITELYKLAEGTGIKLHLDGARIWNAHIASGVALPEYAKYFETVSVCLSKGLGAPVGSLMLSTKETIGRARVWRKRYGAGMRQVGILAAAGHYALDTNLPLLKDDHRRAHFLAEKLHEIVPSIVDPKNVETNIVSLDLSDISLNAAEFALLLKNEGVLVSALGPNFARVVTHLDIDDKGIEFAAEAMEKVLQGTLVA